MASSNLDGDRFVTLRGGVVVPAPAYLLLLSLEARGFTLTDPDDGSLIVKPADQLTEDDRVAIRRWKYFLLSLIGYCARPGLDSHPCSATNLSTNGEPHDQDRMSQLSRTAGYRLRSRTARDSPGDYFAALMLDAISDVATVISDEENCPQCGQSLRTTIRFPFDQLSRRHPIDDCTASDLRSPRPASRG